MARTARRKDGGDTLTDLMRAVGAEPRRRAPRGPRHRAEPEAPAKVKLPPSGKVRRISALSAGGVIVGGLMVVLLAPSDAVDVISGIPPTPPSLTIVPQAVEGPGAGAPAPAMPTPSAPPGGAVAPPPPLAASMNGSQTSTPPPAPAPAPTSSAAPEQPDPRADWGHGGGYYGPGYGGGYYGGGYYGGGRYPQPGGYYR